MRLVHVGMERFRGVRHLEIPLDLVTVVIGENNHGKTSFFDVLGLCLARQDPAVAGRFREDDFFRSDAGDEPGDIRIVLTFAPDGADHGHALAAALVTDEDGEQRLRVEFYGSARDRLIRRRFVDQSGAPLHPQPDPELLDRLRGLHPLLLLRLGHPSPEVPAHDDGDTVDRRGRGPLEALIGKVYHDLTHTRGPLPAAEISRGLRAARRLFGRGDGEEATDAPMHRMLNEILSDSLEWGGSEKGGFRVTAGSGAHTIGLLLVLGAMLEVRGEGALAQEASPIIAIEEPAAHLHPILLASTWDVVEALRAQTVVTTNSGELLSSVPMQSLRRLVRGSRGIDVRRVRAGALTDNDSRRLGYHIRAKRGVVLFARCWLLVEGESEFWLMTQLAHVMGWDLEAEGVHCLEFAQCGVAPLVKLANELGIEWHVLADGDESGSGYARDAVRHLHGRPEEHHISQLAEHNIERCLWKHDFDRIYVEAAGLDPRREEGRNRTPPSRVIAKAVRKRSKPYLALAVAEACAARGPGAIPTVLRRAIEASVRLAREAADGRSHPGRGQDP